MSNIGINERTQNPSIVINDEEDLESIQTGKKKGFLYTVIKIQGHQ